jgi:uncharacterized membrane protein
MEQQEGFILLGNQHKVGVFIFGSVWFLEQKPVQTGFAWFFWFGSILARFFSGSARFFSGSRLKKSKPNRTDRFFQNFNQFFSQFGFFDYFFLVFSV